MATRSRISFERPDGKVRSIYCHWDGYPEHNGKILLENYNESNLDALMDLGDLSTLGTTPVEDPNGWTSGHDETKCITYKSRGETDVDALEFDNIEDFNKNVPEEEYNYIFQQGEWYMWEEAYEDDDLRRQLKILKRVI